MGLHRLRGHQGPNRTRRCHLKADASRQQTLLDLQALDTRLDQIAHAKDTLAVQRQLDQATARMDEHTVELVRARTALDDVQRELSKADSDVQLVRDRANRNQSSLDAGQGTAKDMQALQHELESLGRRQSELEDEELEVMERAEELASRAAVLEASRADLTGSLGELERARDAALGTLADEEQQVQERRGGIRAELPDDLLLAGLTAWSGLVGGVTLELFGHLDNAVGDREAWFDALAHRLNPFAPAPAA